MPAAEDGEWDNFCSNVVCVRTKSSKESENNDDVPVISIQPTVIRSVYRNEASVPHHPPPQPPRTTQRRRITRLIQTPTLPPSLTSPSSTLYEGISKVSINLKPPVTTSVYNGPDFSRLPFTPSRRSIAVKRSSFEPKPSSYDLPEVTRPLPTTSGRSYRPSVSLGTTIRSSSVPPIPSSSYLRRASFSVPASSYSTAYTSYGPTGRQTTALGSGGSVTSSPLRRGSVDVSYLSRLPDSYKSTYGYRPPPPVPSPGIGSTYRRGSLSVGGADNRPTYRSSIAGRLAEDEFKSSAPDAFSSLRSRTQLARDKLDTHKSLIDRYLPGGGSRAPSVDSRFAYQTDRNSELESFSRRGSLSVQPRSRSVSVAGSRAPSLERHEPTPAPSRAPASSAPMPAMSAARRRIRSVLYKVSGDHEYLS